MVLRKILKVLHEVSAAGIIGSIAACLVLAARTFNSPLAEHIAARQDIADIARWVMLPSMVVVLISGLLAMAATSAYLDAVWVWIKAALGISVFEGTLVFVGHAAHQVATLWLLMGVALINVVLSVWRPRFWS